MSRPVFISAYNLAAPGIRGVKDLARLLAKSGVREPFSFTGSPYDAASNYYPHRSDVKSMREDVIAAVICVSELLAAGGFNPEQKEKMPLYVASGISLGEFNTVISLLREAYLAANAEAKNPENYESIFYPVIPPLSALRTLTNAIESFVSIYCGLAGDNTTFGSTSAGGFYALSEAYYSVSQGESEAAIAGGANIGEDFLPLVYRWFSPRATDWNSSTCAAFFILESADSLADRKTTPLGELKNIRQLAGVPTLFEKKNSAPYAETGISAHDNTYLVYGGGLSDVDYEAEKKAVERISSKSFSLYPLLGNTGGASALLSVAAALSYLQTHSDAKTVICLERDPYEREFIVELSNPEIPIG